ncbi:macrophage migration inhibitory factor-like [Ostrinia furnacalis]|uniref:macrophage migration inhibitory factor-like n=1 Tax=Ostrinia furnacalis TaxID=93504 RepID=UPI00103FFDDA|nr:macrophage migration inhibitory factor-like [Ostrinia furnacalis]
MPCFTILTNVPKSKIPVDFADKIIPVLSRVVGKSADKFTCIISGDCIASFGGDSTSPGAVATLESIGNLNSKQNRVIVKELSDFLAKEINVMPDRFFISLYDIQSHNVGRFGKTAEELLG